MVGVRQASTAYSFLATACITVGRNQSTRSCMNDMHGCTGRTETCRDQSKSSSIDLRIEACAFVSPSLVVMRSRRVVADRQGAGAWTPHPQRFCVVVAPIKFTKSFRRCQCKPLAYITSTWLLHLGRAFWSTRTF